MYCAHKTLHQVNETKQTKENSNESILQSLIENKSEIDQQQQQLKCLQCGLNMPNVLQYILHIQTFHQNSDGTNLNQIEQKS